MNYFNILVDLGNIDLFRSLNRLSLPLVADRIDTLINKSMEAINLISEDFFEAKFRLYHGWFDSSGNPSDLFSLIRTHIKSAYPTRIRRARIFVDLAEGPACKAEYRMPHTLRIESGLPSYSYHFIEFAPKECKKPQDCAMLVLKQWIKGNCPNKESGCTVTINDIVNHKKQKLVDTMIIADLIWYALKKEVVAVLSNDEDVIPGLLTASHITESIYWICRSGRPREQYKEIFSNFKIGFLSCQI